MAKTKTNKQNSGTIIRVQGPIVDVIFKDEAPLIYEALTVETLKGMLTLETEFEMGSNEVRTLALGPTEGLRRGQKVTRTFEPIKVPTGAATLGRIFNVLGQPIDGLGAVAAKGTKLEPIHKQAPLLSDQSTKPEMLETGLKVI